MMEYWLITGLLLACAGCLQLLRRERLAHQRTRADYRARLAAACDGLRACQGANDQLAAAVREREQAIGGLLRRLNDANVALAMARSGRFAPAAVLSLPRHHVTPTQFNQN